MMSTVLRTFLVLPRHSSPRSTVLAAQMSQLLLGDGTLLPASFHLADTVPFTSQALCRSHFLGKLSPAFLVIP